MKKTNKVWVVTGYSESCDDYGPEVYSKEPSDAVLRDLVENWDYDDGEGPGDFGSYVHLNVTECEVK